MLGTYLRALATAPLPRPSSLPAVLREDDVVVGADHLVAFQRLCGPYVGAPASAAYPHLLAFPVALRLMAERSFPLPLPGLVHVRQHLRQRRPVEVGERLHVRVHAEGLRPHPRGTQVDLVAEAAADGYVVWSGRSTYLARGRTSGEPGEPGVVVPEEQPPSEDGAAVREEWRVPASTGPAYAAVSGDVNPIHLHPLAARAFGFPRTIAHGMWSAARCAAVLQRRLPPSYDLDVAFRKPVLLPARATFVAEPDAGTAWSFGLRGTDGRVHLVGTATPR